MNSVISMLGVTFFVISAFCAGILNGLLGTGGGIIMTYVMAKALKGGNYSPKDVFVCSMMAVIPISAVSLFTYPQTALPKASETAAFILAAVPGGLVGAVLSDKLKSVFVEKAFAVLIIYAGVRMILR